MKVPFLNLKRLNLSYKNHLEDRFEQVLDSGTYLWGENVSTFEKNFARYCETEFCDFSQWTWCFGVHIERLRHRSFDEVLSFGPNSLQLGIQLFCPG